LRNICSSCAALQCFDRHSIFGIFIDDLVKLVNKANVGCKMGTSCAAIFLYADDVILLAPSVHALQLLVNICDCELNFLEMAINARKSSCMRFGPRHKSVCADVSVSGFVISWTTSFRYLGVLPCLLYKELC